ncbi:MAG: hypothetical protein IPM45_17755 [Acidimicrobiales bacterium]|nr:hypothetical protein [Acidimicrobiales bacterium]
MARDHGRFLYTVSYRLTGNHDDAEDLVQEVLVRVRRGWTRTVPAPLQSAGWAVSPPTPSSTRQARRKKRGLSTWCPPRARAVAARRPSPRRSWPRRPCRRRAGRAAPPSATTGRRWALRRGGDGATRRSPMPSRCRSARCSRIHRGRACCGSRCRDRRSLRRRWRHPGDELSALLDGELSRSCRRGPSPRGLPVVSGRAGARRGPARWSGPWRWSSRPEGCSTV